MSKPDPIIYEPGDSGHIRNKIEPVNRNLRVINPRLEGAEEITERFERRRVQYAPMHAHMELAAQALAAGATFKMTARYAGVSVRQVKKYYKDADFRERIEEIRSTMLSKLKGRIVKELGRRTGPEEIKQLELLDVLRIGDRVGLARGSAVDERASSGGNNSYEQIFNTIVLSHSGAEGGDFPEYEPNRLALPGEDSPVE